jgi:hypothetical protein
MRQSKVKLWLVGVLVVGSTVLSAGAAVQAQHEEGGVDWVSMAVDKAGRWAWQWDATFEGARLRALDRCGESECGTAFTVHARCIAYAESHTRGYWYGVAHGRDHAEVQSMAMDGCGQGAPPDTCHIVRNHCQGEPIDCGPAQACQGR